MCTASSLSWDCFSLALSCDRDRAQVVHLSLAAVPWKRAERHCNAKRCWFALDLIILAMHIWILIRVALLNRVGDARIQNSNWFGTGWLEFRSNGMGQCRTDNANIPVHPVQPGHMIYWARLCDIPDASFLTTLFVGVSGKHFFMGLVKRIGSLNFVRLRAFACVCACVLLLLLYFSVKMSNYSGAGAISWINISWWIRLNYSIVWFPQLSQKSGAC